MTDSTHDQSSKLTITFAPIEAALLKAFALRTNASKPLVSLRPLVWLAYLALAQWFGLAHLITPEMRTAAIELARRPGRRKTEPDGQASLLDMLPMNDGRPGVYVSFVRLRTGTVRESSGDATLDLHGCHEPGTAIVRAYEQGWIGGPSGNGLRFIPPTIWGLVVDHNSAGFARNGGVDEHIASLEETNRQWQIATDAFDPTMAKRNIDEYVQRDKIANERIELLEKSIAESARLPIVEPKREPCPHKGVMLFDGKRTCTACKEVLPELSNEKKVGGFRKKAHATLTAKEDPREPLPSQSGTTTKSSKGSRAKESSNKKPTKKASKGRAS